MGQSLPTLAALDLCALIGLYEAHCAAANALGCEAQTPRAARLAHAILTDEEERHYRAANAVVMEIQGREYRKPAEAVLRAAFLAARHAEGQDWEALTSALAEGVAAQAVANRDAIAWLATRCG